MDREELKARLTELMALEPMYLVDYNKIKDEILAEHDRLTQGLDDLTATYNSQCYKVTTLNGEIEKLSKQVDELQRVRPWGHFDNYSPPQPTVEISIESVCQCGYPIKVVTDKYTCHNRDGSLHTCPQKPTVEERLDRLLNEYMELGAYTVTGYGKKKLIERIISAFDLRG